MRSLRLFLALPLAAAAPSADVLATPSSILSNLCQIPYLTDFYPVQEFCKRATRPIQVKNPKGKATSHGVVRYSGKYATATRWGPPVISSAWIAAVQSDPTALPKACPQEGLDVSAMSEDCLDIVLYIPPSAKSTPGGIPTLFWVHGGSFQTGSASDPSLDGSQLAVATNTIVAVVQYRLGVLGFLPPSASTTNSNLGLQDLTTALMFVHAVIPSFGGSSQVTLAGQSSGASLIRALLGTPSVQPLFNNVWLHSDPSNYGFLTPGALSQLRSAWLTELNCTSGAACAQTIDLPTLLDHQANLAQNAPGLNPEFYFAEPIRPSPDPVFMTQRFTTPSSFPSSLKPIVVTNVRDEAVPTIYGIFSAPPTMDDYLGFITGLIGPERVSQLDNSSFYPLTPDLRVVLNVLGTDGIWRCPNWKLARDWASHSSASKQFVGIITQGLLHADNANIPECLAPGVVCHEDDIRVLFGTGSSPLTKELQARYAAFIRTGSPNASGYAPWNAATTSDVKAINLGGASAIEVGACDPSFWGAQVQFDYQVNNE